MGAEQAVFHTVRLVVRDWSNFWFIEHGGPAALIIKEKLGSVVTSTPFPLTWPAADVERILRACDKEVKIC